jgi:hypothetical protein
MDHCGVGVKVVLDKLEMVLQVAKLRQFPLLVDLQIGYKLLHQQTSLVAAWGSL